MFHRETLGNHLFLRMFHCQVGFSWRYLIVGHQLFLAKFGRGFSIPGIIKAPFRYLEVLMFQFVMWMPNQKTLLDSVRACLLKFADGAVASEKTSSKTRKTTQRCQISECRIYGGIGWHDSSKGCSTWDSQQTGRPGCEPCGAWLLLRSQPLDLSEFQQ